ncbi:type VI secretion system baseplate subunit TssK [Acetobacter sp. DsW_063]|uniref:type VI secretion system baseplate subunit TssK n=1 Tax=Acetobacter sp. DsW_063 TaxID=1514894 RepID=UPI000A3A3A76|nr:type VI secretion system baseplate subunit TssK [Acetobacter sp. DsW_063]OUJ16191.1 type VI secretion protein [Acetobacter sp. DsW_063]
MSWANRVVWQEGMFLRAQHFQQQDRWSSQALGRGLTMLRPYSWGFTELVIARDLLSSGRFGLASAAGLFEDGTQFFAPDESELPQPLLAPDSARDVLVHLAVPIAGPGRAEFGDAGRPVRFQAREMDIDDTHSGATAQATIQIGRLAPRLMLDTDDRAGFLCLPVARIVEVTADRRVILDPNWIPPVISCHVSSVLANLLVELVGVLHQRREAIAARLTAIGAKSNSEVTDFMLLQRINGWQSLLSHLADTGRIHPEELYRKFLEMAGELATFTESSRRPESFETYRHDDLQRSFAPVTAAIRRSLSSVLEQTAVQIPLREHRHGVRVGTITDRTILVGGSIVLVAHADVPSETLRRDFPKTAKIGAVEHIRELVNVALPGIELRLLPVAPRQMPYIPGAQYFELERHSPHWEAMKHSGGFAIHVSNDFPNLMLELWAIRA